MMAIWQLLLILGNGLLHWTSATIDWTNPDAVYVSRSFTFKVCMTDGILESIEEATEAGHCSLHKTSEYSSVLSGYPLILKRLGIREFKKNWYQIKNFDFGEIDLEYNKITNLSSNLVNDLPSNIKSIDLFNNKIRTIERNIKNDHLRSLNLLSNEVIIEDGAFKELKITYLSMADNSLKSAEFIKFLPVTLERLDLSGNSLREISHDAFSHLKNLRAISLDLNELTKLEPGLFNNLPYLESIYLSGNKIRELEPGSFRNLNISDRIDLSSNRIKVIHPGAFESSNIEELSLSSNKLTIVNGDSFHETRIGKIVIESNIRFKKGASTGFDTRRLQ